MVTFFPRVIRLHRFAHECLPIPGTPVDRKALMKLPCRNRPFILLPFRSQAVRTKTMNAQNLSNLPDEAQELSTVQAGLVASPPPVPSSRAERWISENVNRTLHTGSFFELQVQLNQFVLGWICSVCWSFVATKQRLH